MTFLTRTSKIHSFLRTVIVKDVPLVIIFWKGKADVKNNVKVE